MPNTSIFYVDAVLFDMDGTLTDSIAAVEAAWGKVAEDLGQDRAHVIAATHGKRAVDNLAHFKPHIKAHEMDDEVMAFENTILYYADAYHKCGPGSRDTSSSFLSPTASDSLTPQLTPEPSTPSSRASSFSINLPSSRRSSFVSALRDMLSTIVLPDYTGVRFEDTRMEEVQEELDADEQVKFDAISEVEDDTIAAWQLEAASVDRSVRILPGVKDMMSSIPDGRYAVATSGAKTYAYGCMTRVGIMPPPVTITADDKRLKAGKPAPDPFLLAAECLGFDASNCVVFEDSPSGIRAGVASGATVIAVCTSHERSKIEGCGAHFLVENMESVKCEPVRGENGVVEKLKFTVTH